MLRNCEYLYSSIPGWNMSRSTFVHSYPEGARLERVAFRDRTPQGRSCRRSQLPGIYRELQIGPLLRQSCHLAMRRAFCILPLVLTASCVSTNIYTIVMSSDSEICIPNNPEQLEEAFGKLDIYLNRCRSSRAGSCRLFVDRLRRQTAHTYNKVGTLASATTSITRLQPSTVRS